MCFPVNFVKFLRTPFLTEHLWWLLLRLNIYIWKTKFSSHKRYLFGLLFSRNARKTHTDQSILLTFLLCLKRNVSPTLKRSSCEKVFPNCVYHGYNLIRWRFFIPCDNWKALFFIQIYRYAEVWCNHHVAALVETSISKKVRILYSLFPQ